MTVESTKTKEKYKGNSAATEFPVPFAYDKTADLRLVRSEPNSTLLDTESEITDNYRIEVGPNGETAVRYPLSGPPLPNGQGLTVYRDTPRLQIVDLIYGGAFSPDTLEHDGLDRIVMMIQEIQEELDRALKVPMSSDKTPEELMAELFNALAAAQEILRQILLTADPSLLDSYAFNIRRSKLLTTAVPYGGILELPAHYYPGRAIMALFIDGMVCTPRKADNPDPGERQYEEIGDNVNELSNQVRVFFPVEAGATVDVWVVASNLMKEMVRLEAMVARAEECAEEACECAEDAAASAAASAAQADRAKEEAERAQSEADRAAEIVDGGSMEAGVYNVRKVWLSDAAVASGGILHLPGNYYPTRDVLFLAYQGVACSPRGALVEASGLYQYEEMGTDPNVLSNTVRVFFPIAAGDELDMWVVSSAAGRNLEALAAAVEAAEQSAAESEASAGRAEAGLAVHIADASAGVHGASTTATGNSIAMRLAAGTLNVGTPTAAAHAATKAYVDAGVTAVQAAAADTARALADAAALTAQWGGVSGKPASFPPSVHSHGNSTITDLDASKITSGVIDRERLPAGATTAFIIVNNDAERFALTTAQIQNGGIVQVGDGGPMYLVIDDTKLSSEAGYRPYTAGVASSVPWSGVTDKPATFPPAAHNQAMSTITGLPAALDGKVSTSDSRLTDARTPKAHAASHLAGGTDAIAGAT
ncbi:hypothetical protein LJC59_01370, partial [Desulfovibrio sp. OttesenSCG-928-A18]|nr:hypothetical protein [Desulfovibrio sp. OttesenSCG-928-A18]